MLDRGCEVNLKDRFNQTALLHACLLPENDGRNDMKYQLINLLIRNGADVSDNCYFSNCASYTSS